MIFNRTQPMRKMPPGYKFIPAGNKYTTRRCRLLANGDLFAVYDCKAKKIGARLLGLAIRYDVAVRVKADARAFGREKMDKARRKRESERDRMKKGEWEDEGGDGEGIG